ncbi:asparagine synthase (glutamine-hydrolyzing) [Phragmitibacter flavus]|uniref:asparagine synthase (glutamine-hydrolyzing) n=1 Tax=Phragmitibacter flavus TaxID=2576071 RepID=A0A5R8K9P7_9BACT|nr:asparagine synthase (glutamine-hydrolyzing) [Phragmitibacter flavus]TLD69034.1 asparagine synthase (glutamine-hydrolyzing) [Phragmitibacter flavus]
MCGIYGFAGFDEEGLLDRMGKVMQHRGPDGRGQFRAPDGVRFAMGMQRLSIIDLEGGWQPVYNEDGSVAVCYNGETYNYLELREELVAKGHVFATHSDTECLVHGYEEWGIEGLLKRMNGMFAFCLYDARRREFFIARDRCGQKPLYYYYQNGKFVFASEAKSILQSGHVSAEPNLQAIDPYLTLRNVPEPQTMFKNINILPVSHYMRFAVAEGNLSIKRYWEVPLLDAGTATYRSDGEYLEELNALFHDAVKLCMRSDVPVGAYLSAGVDSSLTVAAMTRFSSNINTYSLGFDSPVDETPAARETAKFLGTNHHEIICQPEDFDLLPKIVWHMDRPVGDALLIAFYKLAQGAAKDLKVVLGGEGADEAFAGYSFQGVITKVQKMRRKLPWVTSAAAPVFAATPTGVLNKFFTFPADLGSQGKKRVVEFLRRYNGRDLNENFNALRTLWSEDERSDVYTSGFKHLATEQWMAKEREQDKKGPFLDRLLKLQYDEWLQDWALIRQDKNTMAHSLEYRLPFLDHRMIELAFRMPAHLKINKGTDKFIERQLADRVFPPHIARRPKIPFYMPVEYFLDKPQFRNLVADTLNESAIKKRGYFEPAKVKALIDKMHATREFIYCKQVVSLLMLELWHRVFVDKSYRFD